jgi:hypothetical protein
VHAWSSWRQREAASFGASFALALALGLGFQVHPSVTLLGAATVLLVITGHTRLRWSAVAAGIVVSAAALVPWVLAVRREPALLPVSEGFPFRGLVLVFPLVRGALYWLRHGSLGLPGPEARFDFSPEMIHELPRPMDLFAHGLVSWFGTLTVAAAVLANYWLWRGARRRGLAELLGVRPGRRAWVLGYARICFAAALLTYAAAPTTVMWWQPVPLLHGAVLTVALWARALARSARSRRAASRGASAISAGEPVQRARLQARTAGWVSQRVAGGVLAWAAISVAIALLLAFGGPRHRCGGRSNIVIPLRLDHPMLYDLGIHASCRVPIQADGWWPDVLPER